jgi:hypothetical protein
VTIVIVLGDEIMSDISRIWTLEAPRSIEPYSEDYRTPWIIGPDKLIVAQLLNIIHGVLRVPDFALIS